MFWLFLFYHKNLLDCCSSYVKRTFASASLLAPRNHAGDLLDSVKISSADISQLALLAAIFTLLHRFAISFLVFSLYSNTSSFGFPERGT